MTQLGCMAYTVVERMNGSILETQQMRNRQRFERIALLNVTKLYIGLNK